MGEKTLPEWPQFAPRHRELNKDLVEYERARADAAMARLRVAVEALSCLYPGLALDLRYADPDEDRDALVSRVQGIEQALTAIGDLPKE